MRSKFKFLERLVVRFGTIWNASSFLKQFQIQVFEMVFKVLQYYKGWFLIIPNLIICHIIFLFATKFIFLITYKKNETHNL